MAQPLPRLERDMLAFERHFADRRHRGDLKQALAAKLWPDLTSVGYHQALVALIRRPEAEAAAPSVVRSLRRLAANRRRA